MFKILTAKHLFINRSKYIEQLINRIVEQHIDLFIIGGSVIYDTDKVNSPEIIYAAAMDALFKLGATPAIIVLVTGTTTLPIIQSAIKSYKMLVTTVGDQSVRFYNLTKAGCYIKLAGYPVGIIYSRTLPLSGGEIRIGADSCDASENAPAKYNVLITLQSRADIPAYLELNPRGATLQGQFVGSALRISHIVGFDSKNGSRSGGSGATATSPNAAPLCQTSKSVGQVSSGNICCIIYPENSQQLGFDAPINASIIAAEINTGSRAVTAEVVPIDCFGGYLVAVHRANILESYNRRDLGYAVDIDLYDHIKFIFIDCSEDYISRITEFKTRRSRLSVAPKIIIQKVNTQQTLSRRAEITKISPNFLKVAGIRYNISRLQLSNYMIFGSNGAVDLEFAQTYGTKLLLTELGAFGKSTLCNSIVSSIYGIPSGASSKLASPIHVNADFAELSIHLNASAPTIIVNKLSKFRGAVNRYIKMTVPETPPRVTSADATASSTDTYFDTVAANIDELIFSGINATKRSATISRDITLHKETDIKKYIYNNFGCDSHALSTCWYLSNETDVYRLPQLDQIKLYFELFEIKSDLFDSSRELSAISNEGAEMRASAETEIVSGSTTSPVRPYSHDRALFVELFNKVMGELILLNSEHSAHYEKLRATMQYCCEKSRDFIIVAADISAGAAAGRLREVAPNDYRPVNINERGGKVAAGIRIVDMQYLLNTVASNVRGELVSKTAQSNIYSALADKYDAVLNTCIEHTTLLTGSINLDLVQYARESDRISQYIGANTFNVYCGEHGLYDLLRKYTAPTDLHIGTNPELYSVFSGYVEEVFARLRAVDTFGAVSNLSKYLGVLVDWREKLCHITGVAEIISQMEALQRNIRAIVNAADAYYTIKTHVGGEMISCSEFIDRIREMSAVSTIEFARIINMLSSNIISRFDTIFREHLDQYSSPDFFYNHSNIVGDTADPLCAYYYRIYGDPQLRRLDQSRAGSVISGRSSKESGSDISKVSKTSKVSKVSKTSKTGKTGKTGDVNDKGRSRTLRPDKDAVDIDSTTVLYISTKVTAISKLLKIIFDGYKQNVVQLVNTIVDHMSDYRFVNIHLLVFYNTIMYKVNIYREAVLKNVWNDAGNYNSVISNIDLLGQYYLNIYTQKSARVATRQQRVAEIRNSMSRFVELLAYISDIINNYLVTIELDAVFAITADLESARPVLSYSINGRDILCCDTETIVVVSILLRVVLWQLSTVTLPRFFVIDIDSQLRRVSAYTLNKLIALISNPRIGAQFVLMSAADSIESGEVEAEYIYIRKDVGSGTSYIREDIADISSELANSSNLTYTKQIETHFVLVSNAGADDKYQCLLCDVEIHKGNIVRHIDSAKHKSNKLRDASVQTVVK